MDSGGRQEYGRSHAHEYRPGAGVLPSLQLAPEETAIADKILVEIRQRLKFLNDVGLEYLTLDRLSATLSGGEAQRIQLATCLGSRLVGACYVLDEPSIGLHSRDTGRLIGILDELRDLGNTIVVVEHDRGSDALRRSHRRSGPRRGRKRRPIVFEGSYQKAAWQTGTSLTSSYLRGDLQTSYITSRRTPHPKRVVRFLGAQAHNLKGIDVSIPLNMMVAITGVSGSGKSTLVHEVIYQTLEKRLAHEEQQSTAGPGTSPEDWGVPPEKLTCRKVEQAELLKQVVLVDQSPIGRTPRSNPVTYIKAFDLIRELFASTPEADRRGYTAGHFSFNIPGGRCETCQGDGTVTVEMQFLADVELVCDDCKGTRFKPSVLDVHYHGLNIHEVLQLTVKEAISFFSATPRLAQKLEVLDDVGLGYLRLGQSATTLSGGEAQRVKLAAHLSQATSEGTLYIFDEPTTGLHFDDIAKLLDAFERLLRSGGSILIIEHNLEVIRSADWVIDLGPEGGDRGGRIVAEGTPEQISQVAESYTGRYLKAELMPQTPHVEKHFESSLVVRDVIIGMADGLTVPFALAAGLTGAVDASTVIVVAGLAEIAAGSIAMGLGGYLAAKATPNITQANANAKSSEIVERTEDERHEVLEILESYGLTKNRAADSGGL